MKRQYKSEEEDLVMKDNIIADRATITPIQDPLITDFISYIKNERGLSENTVKAYQRDIEDLYRFLKEKSSSDTFVWPPKKSDIETYMATLHTSHLQMSSQSRRMIAIKVFLRFLFREEYIEQNISSLFETPKQWQRIPSVLDYQEIEAILQAPDLSTNDGVRDRAIFELLYGTGIRVSELCSLSIYDVTDEAIRVYGKGGKERIVPIGKKALASVDQYLHVVRGNFDSEKNAALFVTNKGKAITREFVWHRVRGYAKRLGLTKQVSPHIFRHTYASHLLEGGADVRVIQDLLGHAHISSTDRYTHVSKAQIQEAFYNFHPRWEESAEKKKPLPTRNKKGRD